MCIRDSSYTTPTTRYCNNQNLESPAATAIYMVELFMVIQKSPAALMHAAKVIREVPFSGSKDSYLLFASVTDTCFFVLKKTPTFHPH